MARPKKAPEDKYSARRTIAFKPAIIAAIERACRVTEIPIDTWIRAAIHEKLFRDGFYKPGSNDDSG